MSVVKVPVSTKVSVSIRWVFLTAFSFWAGLLARDTFSQLWERITGLYAISKSPEDVAKYKKIFIKSILLQFLLLILVLAVTCIMAIFWNYENINTFGSFNP